MSAANLNPCAAAASPPVVGASAGSPRLMVSTTGGLADGFMRVQLRGHSFRSGTVVRLRLCWSGLARYATYEDLGMIAVRADGAFSQQRVIAISSYPRDVYTIAARATEAIAPGTEATAATRFWPAGRGVSVRASMRVLPATAKPGQRLTIVVSGARPREWLDFAGHPDFATGGFAGGILGRYQASKAGRIQFTYPAPSGMDSVGVWVVTARRPGLRTAFTAAFATFTVVGPRMPLSD